MPNEVGTVTVENARILFRNFKGAEGRYNREGERSFAVIIDDAVAAQMQKDGWNIKYLNPREAEPGEDEHADAMISVAVSYRNRPPQITLITSGGRTDLGEREVEMLDYAQFKNVDLILNPYSYTVNGSSGVKAYLKKMFVTLEEDELDLKYADVRNVDDRNPVD